MLRVACTAVVTDFFRVTGTHAKLLLTVLLMTVLLMDVVGTAPITSLVDLQISVADLLPHYDPSSYIPV